MELRNICYVVLWSLTLFACGGSDVDVDANEATTVETRVDIFDGAALGCTVNANASGVSVTEDGNGKYTLSGVFSDGVVVSATGCTDSDTQSNLPELLGVVLSNSIVISPITTLVVASALAAKIDTEDESFQFSGQTLSVLEIEAASINVVANLGLGNYDPINPATANYVSAAKLDTTGTVTDAVAMRIGLAISTLIKAIEVSAGAGGSPLAVAALAKAVVDSPAEINLSEQTSIETVMASAKSVEQSVDIIIESTSLAISGVVALIGGSSNVSEAIDATTIASAFLNTATETTITDNTKIAQLELSVAGTVSINLPFAPSELAVVATSSNSITLSWADNATTETNYVVQRSAGSINDALTIANLEANITRYIDNSLSEGSHYSYRVYASNSGGDSDYAGSADSASLKSVDAGTLLSTPTELSASLGSPFDNDLFVDLNWLDNSFKESGYSLQRRASSDGKFVTIDSLSANTTSHPDSLELTRGETYDYRVFADISSGADSEFSNEVSISIGFYVSGSVSGLTGTLSIQNNDGDAQVISANGRYNIAAIIDNNSLYNIKITQNPVGQLCSITNPSGQIQSDNISDIDITCTDETLTVSLAGSYQAAPLIKVDSDINDPFAAVDTDNGTFGSAQIIPNYSRVQGFSTLSGTGRAAEGDRYASSEDEFDIYRVILQKDQILRLQVVDFSDTNTFTGDLDLDLYDAEFNLVGFSDSISEFESIVVPADAEYYVVVSAYSGSSKYTLSLDSVSALGAYEANSLDFKVGEALIKLKSAPSVNTFKNKNQSMNLSHSDPLREARVKFDVAVKKQSVVSLFQQASFEQDLARVNPISYRKLKTLQHIKQMNQSLNVEFAEPNYIYYPSFVPNDEHYNFQWHYPAINLPQAWDISSGFRAESNVTIAVIDTGVFLAHPDLSNQLVDGYDFISDIGMAADGDGIDANPDDPGDSSQLGSSSWHGTHVAGTIGALSNNNIDIAGIAWQAKIMPIRALGVGGGTGYDIIQSIRFAAGLSNDSNTLPTQKADIINLSLGGGGYSQSAQNAYNAVRAAGVIVVAAAGNENTNRLSYPASYDGVVSVSATDFANNLSPYSNFGARIDVAAPGGNTAVDLNNDGYGDGVLSTLVDDSSGIRKPSLSFYQGTSMASPHVAGVFALMRAVHPTLSADDIDSLLADGSMTTDLGTAGRDDQYGHGLIDAFKSVQAAQLLANGGTPPPQPALIVVSPSQITLGLGDSAVATISNQGDVAARVTGFSSDASWLTVSADSVDSNGLGDYRLLVDRTSRNIGSYTGTITFDINTGGSVIIRVSILVGEQDTAGDLSEIYVLLLDENGSGIDQVSAVDQGNGVFDYLFSNVAPGSYRIMAGSDIDNDLFICQLAESCGGYPTVSELFMIEAINQNIDDLDFTVDILSSFGTRSFLNKTNSTINGLRRQPSKKIRLIPRE